MPFARLPELPLRSSRPLALAIRCARCAPVFRCGTIARCRTPPVRRGRPGPTDSRLPTGFRVEFDPQARVLDGGAVLVGGAPPRMLHLSGAARPCSRRPLGHRDRSDRGRLARRLLDVGIAHPWTWPAGAAPALAAVTVVVLAGTAPTGWPGSSRRCPADWAARRRGRRLRSPGVDRGRCGAGGAGVLRHPAARRPAAAPNTGLAAADTALVAFVDSDVVPEPAGSTRCSDASPTPPSDSRRRGRALSPIVGSLATYEAVARRSTSARSPHWWCRGPGSRTCRARLCSCAGPPSGRGSTRGCGSPRTSTSCCACTRRAGGCATDPARPWPPAPHHAAGLVAAQGLLGTGAAPLAMPHPGAVPPMVSEPLVGGDVGGLLLLGDHGRPRGRRSRRGGVRRLSRPPLTLLRRPRAARPAFVALGAVGASHDRGRRDPPLLARLGVACLRFQRARRVVLIVALAEGCIDWSTPPRPRPRGASALPRLRARPSPRRPGLRHRACGGRSGAHPRAAAARSDRVRRGDPVYSALSLSAEDPRR